MIKHHCYFTGYSFFRVNYSLFPITFCLTLLRPYYIFDFSVWSGTKWPTGVECYYVLAIMVLMLRRRRLLVFVVCVGCFVFFFNIKWLWYLVYCAAFHLMVGNSELNDFGRIFYTSEINCLCHKYYRFFS